MELRRCGESELKLSALGAGCWAFGGGPYWGHQDQKDVNEVVCKAVDLGINYFDTAESYNDGRSEESLGLALRALSRDRVIIGTKIAPSNTEPDTLIKHCELSLNRLRTDYIDLYMVHWPIHSHSIRHFTDDKHKINHPPNVHQAFKTLEKLKQHGKIRFIGVSNFTVNSLEQAFGCTNDIVVNELPYSLLTRAIEYETLPYCTNSKIGVIGYMTLLQGLLADIYPTLNDVPPWQRRTRHFNCRSCELTRHSEDGAEQETDLAIQEIRQIAEDCHLTVPAISIKWVLANKGLTCALVGARNVKELEANVSAASESLHDETIHRLNRCTKQLMKQLGRSLDYYENTSKDRTAITT